MRTGACVRAAFPPSRSLISTDAVVSHRKVARYEDLVARYQYTEHIRGEVESERQRVWASMLQKTATLEAKAALREKAMVSTRSTASSLQHVPVLTCFFQGDVEELLALAVAERRALEARVDSMQLRLSMTNNTPLLNSLLNRIAQLNNDAKELDGLREFKRKYDEEVR